MSLDVVDRRRALPQNGHPVGRRAGPTSTRHDRARLTKSW